MSHTLDTGPTSEVLMAASFRIYNTLTRTVEAFEPLEEGKVGLYVCGMTVDHAHVGHARAMVVFDAFVRTLRHRGWDVRFVRNFHGRRRQDHRPGRANRRDAHGARRALYWPVSGGRGGAWPDRARLRAAGLDQHSRHQALIQKLFDQGHAYASEGNVWFKVDTFSDYGALSGQDVDQLHQTPCQAKRLRRISPFGRPPRRASRLGTALGTRSPGLAHEAGRGLRVGCDLRYPRRRSGPGVPHHENEIAQSVCGNQEHYARYWMHNGLSPYKAVGR